MEASLHELMNNSEEGQSTITRVPGDIILFSSVIPTQDPCFCEVPHWDMDYVKPSN